MYVNPGLTEPYLIERESSSLSPRLEKGSFDRPFSIRVGERTTRRLEVVNLKPPFFDYGARSAHDWAAVPLGS